jgi:hypothetical protein
LYSPRLNSIGLHRQTTKPSRISAGSKGVVPEQEKLVCFQS